MKAITLTIGGKCAFCHSKGEYVQTESTYGWRHADPVCEPFIGALNHAPNVKPLEHGIGWEVIND
jgi:hypothetical protein